MTTLNPPFAFYGCKRRELNKIFEHVPSHNTFIDVFGGSGCVAVNACYRELSTEYIYNDKNSQLIDLMRRIKDPIELQTMIDYFLKVDVSRDVYMRLNELTIPIGYVLLYRKHYGYRGGISDKMFDTCWVPKRRKYEKIFIKYHETLQNIEITNKDWLSVLDEHKNDRDTFIYCDPPYLSKSQKVPDVYEEQFTLKEYELLFSTLTDDSYKCKIMINCDFSGFMYANYKSNIKDVYPKNYAVKHKTNHCQRYQAILTNY